MTNAFTLDDIRTATIKKYAPVTVGLSDGGSVELKSLLKLKKDQRESVSAAVELINEIQDVEDEDDETLEEWSELLCGAIEKIFKIVCSSPRRLLAELDHDDPQVKATLYTEVLTRWLEETQLGEAASSPS